MKRLASDRHTKPSAAVLGQGKENDSREPAPLSLDGNGAGGEGERELFPTESINSEASVAHLVAGSDIMSARLTPEGLPNAFMANLRLRLGVH